MKKKAQQVEAEEDQSTLSAQSEKQPDVAQAGVREHKFQNEWLKKWPWLSKTETGMQCTLCLKHNKKNAFTTPHVSRNYRTNTLERHVEVSDHRHTVQAEAMNKQFVEACATATAKNLSEAVR